MIHRTLLRLLLVFIFVLNVGNLAVVQAQGGDRDGDGLPDSVDQCPDQAGPRENRGCPWPDRDGDGLPDQEDRCPDQAGPRDNGGCPLPDRDGDGVPDRDDRCPDQSGPRENGGCPLDPPPDSPPADAPADSLPPVDVPADLPADLPPPVNLPALPTAGQCVLATLGVEGVRIREWPSTEAPVLGALDPEQLYEVSQLVLVGNEVWWWLSQGGFVADWVTRYGGDNCLLLPAVQLGDGWLIKGGFDFGSDKMQDFHFLVMFDNTGAVVGVWDALLGDDGALKINPGALAGFDPQPDPPGEDTGFDPQPDPPLPGDFGLGPVIGFGAWGDPHLPGWFLGDAFGAMGDGSVRPSWLLPALGDGSVKPGEALIVLGDGSVMPVDPALFLGDGSVMPSWLLPALGDGSVMPSWLLPAVVFPDGGTALGCIPVGKAQSGDPHELGALCSFTNGAVLAQCSVGAEQAFCAYSAY